MFNAEDAEDAESNSAPENIHRLVTCSNHFSAPSAPLPFEISLPFNCMEYG
jgi:hypothetical protein